MEWNGVVRDPSEIWYLTREREVGMNAQMAEMKEHAVLKDAEVKQAFANIAQDQLQV